MKALIFDFDGTLADTFALAADIFYELTGRSQPMSAEEVNSLRGQPAREVIQRLGIPWRRVPTLLAKGRQHMHSRLSEAQPFPGLVTVLSQLNERGHRLFVLSSNEPKNIDIFLTEHKLRPFFDKIYGNIGLFGKAKALRKVLREQNLQPAECIYIGDEVRDIHAAQKLDMSTIAVTWGYNNEQVLEAAKPTYLVRKPAELLAICGA